MIGASLSVLLYRSLPFKFTDGVWVPMARGSEKKIWYRGVIVPMETQECIMHIPMTILAGPADWRIYIGAGYQRSDLTPVLTKFHLNAT